ncbi:uracil-DNA glycosylase family protein [Acetobacteraceae bacterium KSS8]|uniref:Uracil-DNA glycosylase family protein n=1 Tax=Endosaccharibacter trunci TaxID=2812733 RepID=A0ABT1W325_9PROT|nr:uracil-DNA glycosylase family protein [Acetobacteraceae bacterium KSS8]
MNEADALDALVREVRGCTVCAPHLPLGPRPILHVSTTARILIASQAPGTKVHEKGVSFWDASGDRLRGWLGMDKDQFYDTSRVAILPMGLCYPGRLPNGGDCPPRPECAPLWRERVLSHLSGLRLTLLVGSYSQRYVLGPGSVTERVRAFERYLPRFFPLPHPSWRTGVWESRNPWFAEQVLPALRRELERAFGD